MAEVRVGQSVNTPRHRNQKTSPLLFATVGLIPVGVALFLIPKLTRFIKHKLSKPKEEQGQFDTIAGIYYGRKGTIRKHYKVNKEEQIELLQDNRPEVEVQEHDDVVETYEEDEVEKAGAMGGGNKDMLAMLQQMGFRLVAGQDGSMMLVPPGKEGQAALGLEGYDDEDDE